jgi:catechol 2,3-dioxygenase-like lactoylglutathione lyase family enzyme
MQEIISKIVQHYESGAISRRQLVQGLAAVATAAQTASAAESTFRGLGLNHVALGVADVERSRDFYQKHFGLPVIRDGRSNCFLGLGKNFLALFRNEKPGMDHYCIAIDNYNPDAVVEELKRQGLNPRRPAGSNRVYFPDPDGLVIQVSSVDHHA